jgi:molybdopterin molybdotransferase
MSRPITFDEALVQISTAMAPRAAVQMPLAGLVADGAWRGCTAATDLSAPRPVPGFDNAAMDGFALRGAGTAAGLCLPVAATVVAGQAVLPALPAGGAIEVMTGAPLPAGGDAVVPLERVDCERDAAGAPRSIRLREPVRTGANVRRAGEDFTTGQPLLRAGEPLDPPRLMALAANGIATLAVRLPPRVALLTTGSELGAAAAPGQIHDANGPYLQAMLAALGVPVTACASVADDPAQIAAALDRLASQADLLISTGGVSAGRLDGVPGALAAIGARTLFHKVGIRPGKPLLFGRHPGGAWLFGLPGNPVAVAVGFRFFVVPALRALGGQPRERFGHAIALTPVRSRSGFRFFGKAHSAAGPDGRLGVTLLDGQESFKISPLLQANCWMIVPEDAPDIAHGDPVPIAPLLP